MKICKMVCIRFTLTARQDANGQCSVASPHWGRRSSLAQNDQQQPTQPAAV